MQDTKSFSNKNCQELIKSLDDKIYETKEVISSYKKKYKFKLRLTMYTLETIELSFREFVSKIYMESKQPDDFKNETILISTFFSGWLNQCKLSALAEVAHYLLNSLRKNIYGHLLE